jgi:hypothetical protein
VEPRVNWTERILAFPVRAAAVADFLQDLRARGSADLNAVLSTLNDGSLVREALSHWVDQGWIVIAPNSRLHALAGPAFTRALSLKQFCGATGEEVGGGTPEEVSAAEEG